MSYASQDHVLMNLMATRNGLTGLLIATSQASMSHRLLATHIASLDAAIALLNRRATRLDQAAVPTRPKGRAPKDPKLVAQGRLGGRPRRDRGVS